MPSFSVGQVGGRALLLAPPHPPPFCRGVSPCRHADDVLPALAACSYRQPMHVSARASPSPCPQATTASGCCPRATAPMALPLLMVSPRLWPPSLVSKRKGGACATLWLGWKQRQLLGAAWRLPPATPCHWLRLPLASRNRCPMHTSTSDDQPPSTHILPLFALQVAGGHSPATLPTPAM